MSLISKLSAMMQKVSWFSKEKKHSLAFLNGAQFFGVINDNLFKLLLVFMLIDLRGQEEASNITSLAGAIFVIPFLLFSSTAGVLADRFSKQRLLIGMKIAETIIMGLAIFAFGFQNGWVSYILLFLLSTHSAIFGPSKYGIIPEIVNESKVPKANGLITGFTYLAIIIGTFLASFLTEVTNRHFVIAVSFCLLFALIGLFSAFGIKKTPAQGSKKGFNLLFIREIYYTLVFCRTIPHLLPAMLGAAFFLFLGGFTQLNIIPFAIQSLHLREVAGGYLFLAVAFGIALGSFLAGRLCKNRIELGLPCLAGFAITILLLLLSIFSHNLILTVILLFLLGVFGGMFIIPCESFLQVASPDEKRGQVIAAGNFMSFVGVLLASFALFFFSSVLKISSAHGFAVMAFLTFAASLLLSLRLAEYAFPFLFKVCFRRFYKLKIDGEEQLKNEKKGIFVFDSFAWRDLFILLSMEPRLHFYLNKSQASVSHKILSSMTIVENGDLKAIIEMIKDQSDEEKIPCIIIDKEAIEKEIASRNFWQNLLSIGTPNFFKVTINRSTGRIFHICISNISPEVK